MTHIKPFLTSLVALLISLSLQAQDTTPPKQILESGDIDKMINTYPAMVKDFEKLNIKYDNVEDISTLQALTANKEVQAILQKYGWNEAFYPKFMAMAQGIGIIEMEKQFEDIPEEQKPYMEQMIQQYQLANKDKIHPADLALIKANHNRLMKFFDEQ